MKQVPADKYTIAWFKLAECISRGEKERALGVYRLLSHSLEDSAFVHQLEGDIFLSFNDNQEAIENYYKAAQLYKKDNRLLEAAAVYEHLLTIQPDNKRYRTIIISLYNDLFIQSKVKEHVYLLVDQLQNEQGDSVDNIMKKVDPSIRDVVAKFYTNKYKGTKALPDT